MPLRPISYAAELLTELPRDRCRWPCGDPQSAAFRWCAAPISLGSSYCDQHQREAVDPEMRLPDVTRMGIGGRRR